MLKLVLCQAGVTRVAQFPAGSGISKLVSARFICDVANITGLENNAAALMGPGAFQQIGMTRSSCTGFARFQCNVSRYRSYHD
jgi:hypothetical protein